MLIIILAITAQIVPASAQPLTVAGRQAMPAVVTDVSKTNGYASIDDSNVSIIKRNVSNEKRLAKSLLDRRWKEIALREKATALSNRKRKILELKDKAKERQKIVMGLFRDGKAYRDFRFYKEAIAAWYEVLLLPPRHKKPCDDKKAESFIISAQKALKNYTEAKIRRHKDQADTEARLTRSALKKAKKAIGEKDK